MAVNISVPIVTRAFASSHQSFNSMIFPPSYIVFGQLG